MWRKKEIPDRAACNRAHPRTAAYLAEIAMGITEMLFVGRLGSVERAAGSWQRGYGRAATA